MAEQFFAGADIAGLRYQTEDLAVYGDSAWHIATYRGTIRAAGQPDVEERGSLFVLWTRDAGGTWRIKTDILNSHVPLPAPGAR